MRAPTLALVLLTALLAGCFDGPPAAEVELTEQPYYDPANGHYHFRFTADGKGPFHLDFAPGSLSFIENNGDVGATLTPPENALVVTGDAPERRFSLAADVELGPGARVDFLAPPSADTLRLLFDGASASFFTHATRDHEPSWNQVVSGEAMLEELALQESTFPHREPGSPTYTAAMDHFTALFEDLGYTVEVDPYGLSEAQDLGLPCQVARGTSYCLESLANVVATKPGTTRADELVVFGGHFDVVNTTVHGALDNTAGTAAVLELARVFAPFTFERTLVFALWGGEENGLLGSNFWLETHPVERAQVVTYWNLDVVGMSWPAPIGDHDPIELSAGPDVPHPQGAGQPADPVGQLLLDQARTLHHAWLEYPDEANGTPVVEYFGVVSGQTVARESTAQSDHTAFIARGIPSFAVAHGDLQRWPARLHTPSDTLTNMTKYAVLGPSFTLEEPGWPSEELRVAGEAALARSFEAALLFPFYHVVLMDLDVFEPPTRP